MQSLNDSNILYLTIQKRFLCYCIWKLRFFKRKRAGATILMAELILCPKTQISRNPGFRQRFSELKNLSFCYRFKKNFWFCVVALQKLRFSMSQHQRFSRDIIHSFMEQKMNEEPKFNIKCFPTFRSHRMSLHFRTLLV